MKRIISWNGKFLNQELLRLESILDMIYAYTSCSEV